jgi:hypothetical protein
MNDRAQVIMNSSMTRREMSKRIAALEALHLPKLKRDPSRPKHHVAVPVGHLQTLEGRMADAIENLEDSVHWLKDFQTLQAEQESQS